MSGIRERRLHAGNPGHRRSALGRTLAALILLFALVAAFELPDVMIGLIVQFAAIAFVISGMRGSPRLPVWRVVFLVAAIGFSWYILYMAWASPLRPPALDYLVIVAGGSLPILSGVRR